MLVLLFLFCGFVSAVVIGGVVVYGVGVVVVVVCALVSGVGGVVAGVVFVG